MFGKILFLLVIIAIIIFVIRKKEFNTTKYKDAHSAEEFIPSHFPSAF